MAEDSDSDIEALLDPEVLKKEKERIKLLSHPNNVKHLIQKLNELKDLYKIGRETWVENLELTSKEPLNISDPNDDLNRETEFYSQALKAVGEAHILFKEHNIKYERPDDYFAEMLKTDLHMNRVKDRLLASKRRIEEAVNRRKQRSLKEYGKKVQVDVKLQREKLKKENMATVAKWRKEKKSTDVKEQDVEDLLDSIKYETDTKKPSLQNNKLPGKKRGQKRQREDNINEESGTDRAPPRKKQKPKRLGKHRRKRYRKRH
eukprot:TRINITY_DN1606_c0_g1_i1.p1 TRINITY_DN1606_c0_g1~~TRINITY_DN1606_c0_g1_i1.p1  ORF type:complete len:261 (-),score=60.50 TRINITY_DN1606_c0_g1_i1:143-925(-)